MNVYIVTGCAGFIGSHFVDLLFEKERDCVVLGIDKLTYAACINNMSTFWRRPNFHFLGKLHGVIIGSDRRFFIQSDESHITNEPGRGAIEYNFLDINEFNARQLYFAINKIFALDDIDQNIRRIGYEVINNSAIIEGNKKISFLKLEDFADEDIYIVNFAAESHVDRSIKDASPFIASNINGTVNMLEQGNSIPIKKFLQVSTDEVYGSVAHPCKENTPLAPSSPYSASKASADLLAKAYHTTYGLPIVITRSSNNYGPRQFPEKVIPLFISRLMNRQPVPLYGEGDNIRDWIYVEDNCNAIYKVLHNGKNGEVYNIGSGYRITNIELAKKLISITKNTYDEKWIEYVEDRKGHDKSYWLDSSKVREELGWAPTVDFDEGIHKTIQWYIHALNDGYFHV